MNSVHNSILRERPPTAIDCVSMILIDKPGLKNVYKANCTDSVCFSSYLAVHIKCCVYLHGSGMDPKNLKAAKPHTLLWEVQMGLVRLLPETHTPRSLKLHKPQRKTENTECGTSSRKLSQGVARTSGKIRAWQKAQIVFWCWPAARREIVPGTR